MRRVVETLPNRIDVDEVQTPSRSEAQPQSLPVGHQDRASDMRPHNCAPVRKSRVSDCEMQWCNRQVALADRQVDGVTLVPDPLQRLAEGPTQPSRRRHDAAVLARKVDARRMPKAQRLRPPLHVERARRLLSRVEHRSEAIEPGVARDRERLVEIQARVDRRLDVVEDDVSDR